jgi:SPP1 family predicted phage head-tail adaptor
MAKEKVLIGDLNRRIEIYEAATTLSLSGAETITWTCVHTCMAKVDFPTTGNSEMFIADQQTSITRVDYTIRYRAGITTKHKITYKGTDYDIRNIGEIGRRQYLTLQCESRI